MSQVICSRCKKEMFCYFTIFSKQRAWLMCYLQNHGWWVGNEKELVWCLIHKTKYYNKGE